MQHSVQWLKCACSHHRFLIIGCFPYLALVEHLFTNYLEDAKMFRCLEVRHILYI